MARLTTILFQAIWVLLAIPCTLFSILLAWALVSDHLPNEPMSPLPIYSGISLLLFSMLICVGVVYAAYRAVFHFSPGVVDVTVTLPMLLLGLFAWARVDKQVLHFMSRRVEHPSLFTSLSVIIAGFTPFLIIWAGARICELIKRAINKLIFRGPGDLSVG